MPENTVGPYMRQKGSGQNATRT